MSKKEYGWAVEETQGARNGYLVNTYVPFQFLINTAIFKTRIHAQTFIDNARLNGKARIVRVEVSVNRVGDDT